MFGFLQAVAAARDEAEAMIQRLHDDNPIVYWLLAVVMALYVAPDVWRFVCWYIRLCRRAVTEFYDERRRRHAEVDADEPPAPVFGPHLQRAVGHFAGRAGDLYRMEVECPAGGGWHCAPTTYTCTDVQTLDAELTTNFTGRCATCDVLYYVHVHCWQRMPWRDEGRAGSRCIGCRKIIPDQDAVSQ